MSFHFGSVDSVRRSLWKNVGDSNITSALEEFYDESGNGLYEQQDIDAFLSKFTDAIVKLKDSTVEKIVTKARMDQFLTKDNLKIRVNAISEGEQAWDRYVKPCLTLLHSIKLEEWKKGNQKFDRLGTMVDAAFKALIKVVTVPGGGKLKLPTWSGPLEKLLRAELKWEGDRVDRPLKELGFANKQDLVFLANVCKEFCGSAGSAAKFLKHVYEVVDENRLKQFYRDLCKRNGRDVNSDDFDYGIQHEGPLRLLYNDLDYLAFWTVQHFVEGPAYLDRDVSDLSKRIKKETGSFLGKIFGHN